MAPHRFFGLFILVTYTVTIFWAWWKNKEKVEEN